MPHILVVDDSAADCKEILELLTPSRDYQVTFAVTHNQALSSIKAMLPDAVLLDPSIENLSGPTLVEAIHARFPQVPVVVVTSKGNEEVAIQALKNGASSYVPKHMLREELARTLQDVLDVSHRERCHTRMLEHMTDLQCRFVLGHDRSLIPPLVNYFQQHVGRFGLCGEAEITRVGIALDEALVNALYHGNLELDSKLREEESDTYYQLAEQRMRLPPYNQRRIFIQGRLTPASAEFVIKDEGPGFDPATLPDPTDPANLGNVSGRGVLLMRTFMDDIKFNSTGNCVTMRKHRNGQAGL